MNLILQGRPVDEDQLPHVNLYPQMGGRGLAVVGEPQLLPGKSTYKYTVKGTETGVFSLEFRSNTPSGRVVRKVGGEWRGSWSVRMDAENYFLFIPSSRMVHGNRGHHP
jgi:hypothetical protein